jgi:repressor LexA
VLGRVAAGQPILAEESFDETLQPNDMFGDLDGVFALKVRGDSMIDAGILEGDHVIVRQQPRANAGEIVVALLGDEATVKYYQPRRGTVELVAANIRYQPIVVGAETEFRILGVVKGVIRTVGR